MKRTPRDQDSGVVRSGDLLTEQYRSAMLTLSTVSQASRMAAESEQSALQSLAAVPAANSVYVTPQDIPPEIATDLTKHSLDAHLQKVQSAQIGAQGEAFVRQLQQEALAAYKGRKVRINVLDAAQHPVEVYWRDAESGGQYLHKSRPRMVKGRIEDINLAENVLILAPDFIGRFLSSRLSHYAVYVINPLTIQPMVRIALM